MSALSGMSSSFCTRVKVHRVGSLCATQYVYT